ncbi:MAG: hypothetical protein H3C59_09805, partial [Burkholderiaceae bacterium]|nr:hypothetical protein [Burkholderiaceae bacterium]
RGRMVGCDQYLTKPFTKDALLRAASEHARSADTLALAGISAAAS